jgi:tetratricopeptide (TPR) repeat protein
MTAELFLSRFTPSMMSADVLEKVFVQRGDMADRIVEVLRESVLTPSKHHTLVIGSRGIGKTHLLSLIQNRIASQDDLADRVRIAWLREEEWGVASFLDFLYRILRALATRYEDEELREQTEELFSLPLKTAERRAADLLRGFIEGRTLLLIAENLDSVFGGLGKKGQQRLRAYLQEESSWTILASSQALFGGVTLYDSPFYGFFDIHHLEELTVDDAARLVRNIAELANDTDLAEYVQSDAGRARIRAVHHLAGGNHRVYMILSEFLTRDSLDQLVEPFLRMMDDLTPYYQARMEQLSPQQRKIIDLLCSVRGAVTVKEIAKRCFISSQTASSQLRDLRERGYVQSTPVGRDAYYELAEPLMRLALEVKHQRSGHVRLFLDFLRHWYARPELVDLLARTPAESVLEREYLQSVLQAENQNEDPALQNLMDQILDLGEQNKWTRALPLAQKLVQQRGGVADWTMLATCLVQLGDSTEALDALDRALNLDNNFPMAWGIRSVALLGTKQLDEALDAITRAISLEERYLAAYRIKSIILQRQKRYDEAVQIMEYASSHAPDSFMLKTEYALTLNRASHFKDALPVFESILNMAQQDSRVFTGYVIALVASGKMELALEQLSPEYLTSWLKSVTSKGDRSAIAMFLLGLLYSAVIDGRDIESRALTVYRIFRDLGGSVMLGGGMLVSVSMFDSLAIAPLQAWKALWEGVAQQDENIELALRLLDVLVEYRQRDDPRVLLRLPAEERRILTELLTLTPKEGELTIVSVLSRMSAALENLRAENASDAISRKARTQHL